MLANRIALIGSRDVVNVAAAGRPKIYTQPEIHRPYFDKLDSFPFRNLISASPLKEVYKVDNGCSGHPLAS